MFVVAFTEKTTQSIADAAVVIALAALLYLWNNDPWSVTVIHFDLTVKQTMMCSKFMKYWYTVAIGRNSEWFAANPQAAREAIHP